MSEEIKEEFLDKENQELKEQEQQRQNLRDEVFESFKNGLLENKTLLEKFLIYSREYNSMEFSEFSDPEDMEDTLRKANKLRDKLLTIIEDQNQYILESAQTNTLTDMIVVNIDVKGYQFKIIIEVLDEGFNLEVV